MDADGSSKHKDISNFNRFRFYDKYNRYAGVIQIGV